jgi:DNA-binding NarL/FixJ family response regulator
MKSTQTPAQPESTVCAHCGSVLPPGWPIAAEDGVKQITERQKEVLRLIAAGMTAKEIAENLKISRRTAEFHRAMLMQRLGVHSTAELTLYAAAHRLI